MALHTLPTHKQRLLLVGFATFLCILSAYWGTGLLVANADPQGVISLQLSSQTLVPGNLLDASYSTSPGTLTENVDIYFTLLHPTGQLLFLQSDGSFADFPAPFRSDVDLAEEEPIQPLFRLYPVYIPFGTYKCSLVLVHVGGSLLDANAYASPVASATFSFTALSQAQQDLIAQRGNPEFLVTTWAAELSTKRDSWFYLSSNPTRYIFVNGALESQTVATGSASGSAPNVDPSLLTPQTTLEQLTAAFGSPTSVETVEGVSDYQVVTFSVGLEVVLLQGRLISARTFTP